MTENLKLLAIVVAVVATGVLLGLLANLLLPSFEDLPVDNLANELSADQASMLDKMMQEAATDNHAGSKQLDSVLALFEIPQWLCAADRNRIEQACCIGEFEPGQALAMVCYSTQSGSTAKDMLMAPLLVEEIDSKLAQRLLSVHWLELGLTASFVKEAVRRKAFVRGFEGLEACKHWLQQQDERGQDVKIMKMGTQYQVISLRPLHESKEFRSLLDIQAALRQELAVSSVYLELRE